MRITSNGQLLSLKDSLPLETKFPLYSWKASAGATGFPSPADDYLESSLDLSAFLQLDKNATFFAKSIGDSMVGDSIHDGDILVVNRALKAEHDSIIICVYQGELLIKRLRITEKGIFLCSSNPLYKDIAIEDESELVIWGVVQSVLVNFIKPEKKNSNVRTRRRK
jgi:DNA polymerase V